MAGKKQVCQFCIQMRILVLFMICTLILVTLLLNKSEYLSHAGPQLIEAIKFESSNLPASPRSAVA